MNAGQAAYRAFFASFFGRHGPPFDELDERTRDAWTAAARGAIAFTAAPTRPDMHRLDGDEEEPLP